MYHLLTLILMVACGMLAFGALTTLGTASAVQEWVLKQHSPYQATAAGDSRRAGDDRSWFVSPLSGQR
jgi:hypothetical protein